MSETLDMAVAIIRREEGYRATPYRCTGGVWTIGIGTTIDWPDAVLALDAMEGVGEINANNPPLRITPALAEAMLRRRIERDHGRLASHHRSWYSQQTPERQAILLSMAYQLGIVGLLGFSKMLAALEQGHHTVAALEMLDSRWARQTPARAERQAEAMRTGDISYWINGDQ